MLFVQSQSQFEKYLCYLFAFVEQRKNSLLNIKVILDWNSGKYNKGIAIKSSNILTFLLNTNRNDQLSFLALLSSY